MLNNNQQKQQYSWNINILSFGIFVFKKDNLNESVVASWISTLQEENLF